MANIYTRIFALVLAASPLTSCGGGGSGGSPSTTSPAGSSSSADDHMTITPPSEDLVYGAYGLGDLGPDCSDGWAIGVATGYSSASAAASSAIDECRKTGGANCGPDVGTFGSAYPDACMAIWSGENDNSCRLGVQHGSTQNAAAQAAQSECEEFAGRDHQRCDIPVAECSTTESPGSFSRRVFPNANEIDITPGQEQGGSLWVTDMSNADTCVERLYVSANAYSDFVDDYMSRNHGRKPRKQMVGQHCQPRNQYCIRDLRQFQGSNTHSVSFNLAQSGSAQDRSKRDHFRSNCRGSSTTLVGLPPYSPGMLCWPGRPGCPDLNEPDGGTETNTGTGTGTGTDTGGNCSSVEAAFQGWRGDPNDHARFHCAQACIPGQNRTAACRILQGYTYPGGAGGNAAQLCTYCN